MLVLPLAPIIVKAGVIVDASPARTPRGFVLSLAAVSDDRDVAEALARHAPW